MVKQQESDITPGYICNQEPTKCFIHIDQRNSVVEKVFHVETVLITFHVEVLNFKAEIIPLCGGNT